MISRAAAMPVARTGASVRAVVGLVDLDRGMVAMFLASRLLVLIAAVVAESFIPRNPALIPGDGAPLLKSLTSWDGWFYLGIARDGYQASPVAGAYMNVAFAPLYPLILGILAIPVPAALGIISVAVPNVAFLIALGLLVRLGTPYLGRRRAGMAAGLLAIHPFASVFAMAYTESLFLLLVVAAFLAAERRHRAWAGIALALAVLCRLQGVGLALPLLILMLRQDGWRPRPSQAWVLLGPLALAGFFAYIATVTGSPTAYLDAHEAWGRTGVGSAQAGETMAAAFSPYQAALLLTLALNLFLFVFVRTDRMALEYVLIPVVFIAMLLLSGSLESVGRITLSAFPFVWIIASRRSRLVRQTWPVVSAGLFLAFAVLTFGGYWVP